MTGLARRAMDGLRQGGDARSPELPTGPALLSEFERLLSDPGCPACTSLAEAERSHFAWFANENHTSPTVQSQLRAGMGMCPVHSRRLVHELGAGSVSTIVLRHALAGALPRIRGDGQPGRCVVCDALSRRSESIMHMVIDALNRDADLRRFHTHAGMCLEHLRALAHTAAPAPVQVAAERLLEGLNLDSGAEPVALLADADHDAVRRAVWRRQLPQLDVASSTVEGLCAQLALDTCPVCLATGQSEQLYLQWLLDRSRADDSSLRTEPGVLCPTHLHDVALKDPTAARFAIDRKRAVTIAGLKRLLDHLAARPPAGGRRRRVADDVPGAAAQTMDPTHRCPACRVRDVAEARQGELLLAGLALTPVRRAYEDGHGLCAYHVLRMPSTAPRVVGQVAEARLAVLEWEVQEISRRYAWDCRHEPPGPEQNAWLRGLVQIDGRVFLGGPAPLTVTPEERS